MTARMVLVALTCLGMLSKTALACPFCDAPSTTFSEQLLEANGAAHVEWLRVEKPDPLNFTPGSTTYRVKAIAKSANDGTQVGDEIKIDYYQPGEVGDLFWMLGSLHEEKNLWAPPIAMSRECWDYVIAGPDRQQATAERLKYYLKFLEHTDSDIAIDAYGEFAGAPYHDVKSLKEMLPKDQIMHWIQDPQTTPTRLGLYGLLIGICGGPPEAEILENLVLKTPSEGEVRPGIDGMMAGYILLTGDAGLEKLKEAKLVNRHLAPQETFSVLQLLRFLGVYTEDVVSPQKLQAALRILLEDPQYTDSVILDLARVQDWELIPQLGGHYGTGIYAEGRVKQSIVRYLQAAQGVSITESAPRSKATAEQKSQAKTLLEKIRQQDPQTIRAVERRSFD